MDCLYGEVLNGNAAAVCVSGVVSVTGELPVAAGRCFSGYSFQRFWLVILRHVSSVALGYCFTLSFNRKKEG